MEKGHLIIDILGIMAYNYIQEVVFMSITERDLDCYSDAFLLRLRLLFKNNEKEQYTKEEILELIDSIAMSKELSK